MNQKEKSQRKIVRQEHARASTEPLPSYHALFIQNIHVVKIHEDLLQVNARDFS